MCGCVCLCQSRKATVTESGNAQANIRIHANSLSKHIYMYTPSYVFPSYTPTHTSSVVPVSVQLGPLVLPSIFLSRHSGDE